MNESVIQRHKHFILDTRNIKDPHVTKQKITDFLLYEGFYLPAVDLPVNILH